MKILYIDTCTNFLITSIIEDEKNLVEKQLELGRDLSVYSIYHLDEMFKKVSLKPNDIDKIIVVNGPGSFTGIRIGVTIAKIMAQSLKKDIITISTLEAMSEIEDNRIIVPIIDARRGYVFAAAYLNGKNIIKEQYILLEDLKSKLEEYQKDYIFITNDNIKNEKVEKYKPNILKIVNHYKNRDTINPHLVNPVYLKLTEAEENKKDN